METINIRLTGQSPLLMSADRLADPLDPATIEHKKLTSIRGKAKTHDVVVAIAKSQYTNGVYYEEGVGPVIPTVNIKKCLEEGAKLSRNGDKVRKGVIIFEENAVLEYNKRPKKGFHTPEDLWNKAPIYLDKRPVVVGQSKVMCYRPKFSSWSVDLTIHFDTEITESGWIIDFFNAAGAYVGIGGFRVAKNGNFGRFTAQEI
jgi:hypothetical protein